MADSRIQTGYSLPTSEAALQQFGLCIAINSHEAESVVSFLRHLHLGSRVPEVEASAYQLRSADL